MSVMRFMHPTRSRCAPRRTRWSGGSNDDPATPHTTTFGAEPADDANRSSPNVTVASDVRSAPSSARGRQRSFGIINASRFERDDVPQAAVGITRFRVMFKHAGVYPERPARCMASWAWEAPWSSIPDVRRTHIWHRAPTNRRADCVTRGRSVRNANHTRGRDAGFFRASAPSTHAASNTTSWQCPLLAESGQYAGE